MDHGNKQKNWWLDEPNTIAGDFRPRKPRTKDWRAYQATLRRRPMFRLRTLLLLVAFVCFWPGFMLAGLP